MIPCIENIPNPTPGETYDVPVVGGEVVTGVRHVDDSYFLKADCHWHIDSRFENGLPTVAQRGTQKPIRMDRICKRSTPIDFPTNFGDWALTLLYTKFGPIGAQCGVCPHKGMPVHNGICSGHRLRFKANGDCEFKAPFFFVSSEGEYFQSDKIWSDEWRHFEFEFNEAHDIGWYFDFVDADNRFIRRLDDYGSIRNGNMGKLPMLIAGDILRIRDDESNQQPCEVIHAL